MKPEDGDHTSGTMIKTSLQPVLLQVWRKSGKKSGVLVKFGKAENSLMDYLTRNGSINYQGSEKLPGYPLTGLSPS